MTLPSLRYDTGYALYSRLHSFEPKTALGLKLLEIRKRFMLEEVLTRSKVERIQATFSTINYSPIKTAMSYLKDWAMPQYVRPTDYYTNMLQRPSLFASYNHAANSRNILAEKIFHICVMHVKDKLTDTTLWAWHEDADKLLTFYTRQTDGTIAAYDRHGLVSEWKGDELTIKGVFIWMRRKQLVDLFAEA